MQAPVNLLKNSLKTGDMQLGIWLNLASLSTTEIAAGTGQNSGQNSGRNSGQNSGQNSVKNAGKNAGYDWLLIDGEHAPFDPSVIQNQLRVMASFDVAPVVRVPVFEPWIIKQVLDLGVQSLMVPMVNTGGEAASVVRATRYAPNGIRGMGAGVARAGGFGQRGDYLDNCDDEICVIVQVETRQAFENIDEIANTDGVDCVFIGPADLSADMGHLGNPNHPEVVGAITHIIAQTRKAGKAAGILTFDPTQRAYYEQLGVNFLGVGSDANLLRLALNENLRAARG